MVRVLWVTDAATWEEVVHEADVIALFKKGDRSSLDNYRGICLLQVVSRLIARVAARRLSAHLEAHGVIATEQWVVGRIVPRYMLYS